MTKEHECSNESLTSIGEGLSSAGLGLGLSLGFGLGLSLGFGLSLGLGFIAMAMVMQKEGKCLRAVMTI